MADGLEQLLNQIGEAQSNGDSARVAALSSQILSVAPDNLYARLSLAIALARDPALLLLDEPHAGLDDEGRAALDGVLADAPAAGLTVLLASHEVDRTRPLVTREVRLVAGRVVPDGSAVGR